MKPFDMKPRKAISKKPFESEEENICEEETNLTLYRLVQMWM